MLFLSFPGATDGKAPIATVEEEEEEDDDDVPGQLLFLFE